jgi:predicted dehydrogenase
VDLVRWGLIGCGDIAAKRVAEALQRSAGSALVAVARARKELAAAFAERHGANRWHADWRDLLQDPEVDAVYVATPVRLHAEQAEAAAGAGKHVLCEKPMALDVAGGERMIAAARAHGVRLGVAYYRHHYPVVARLRQLLASGELGDPVLANVQAFESFDLPRDHPRAWFLRRAEAGGGPMADFGCHRIEVLLDLLGPVADAQGFADNVRFRDRDVEDTFVARLRFRSGAIAVLAVTHAAHERRDTLEIFGTRGSAHVGVLNQGDLRVVTPGGVREERHPPHPNLHQPLVEDFVAAVRDGREPAVSGEVGLEVTRVLARLYGQ